MADVKCSSRVSPYSKIQNIQDSKVKLNMDDSKISIKADSKLKPEEADEPLLQENPNRFVVFPIKYHEVLEKTSVLNKFI